MENNKNKPVENKKNQLESSTKPPVESNKKNPQKNQQEFPRSNRKSSNRFYLIYIILAAVFMGIIMFQDEEQSSKITWKELKSKLSADSIVKIVVYNETEAYIYEKNGIEKKQPTKNLFSGIETPRYIYTIGPAEKFVEMVSEAQSNRPEGKEELYIEWDTKSNWGSSLLSIMIWVLPIAFLWFIFARMMRGAGGGGGIFSIGK